MGGKSSSEDTYSKGKLDQVRFKIEQSIATVCCGTSAVFSLMPYMAGQP